MNVNLGEIYQKISLYEETVRLTSVHLSENDVSNEVLAMVSGALNNIEQLAPRNHTWHALTHAQSSRITA